VAVKSITVGNPSFVLDINTKLEVCANCRYWEYEEIDQGHVCVNDRSCFFCDWTEGDDYCSDFHSNMPL